MRHGEPPGHVLPDNMVQSEVPLLTWRWALRPRGFTGQGVRGDMVRKDDTEILTESCYDTLLWVGLENNQAQV